MTILVAEDDGAMRDLLTEELSEAGYAVVAAADGLEALEQLERHAVDILVTDQQMPGMKGRELLDEVRVRRPEVPVIIITAFGSIDAAVDAMRGGAYHFLPKPFGIEDLLRVLDDVVRELSLRRELRGGVPPPKRRDEGGARVMGMVEQPVGEGIGGSRPLVPERPGDEADGGLGHGEGRHLSAGEHEVPEADLLRRQGLPDPLVYSLVAAREEHQPLEVRVAGGGSMVERIVLRGESSTTASPGPAP